MSIKTDFDLTKLRHHSDGQSHSFEDLCCYLFQYDSEVPQDSNFRRIQGKSGDGGVEAIHQLSNGEVWGCQAKFMFDLDQTFHACKKSFKTAVSNYAELSKYVICIPFDLTGRKKGKGGKQLEGKWADFDNWIQDLQNYFPEGKEIKIELWSENDLQGKFINLDSTGGLSLYWFNELTFSDDWFKEKLSIAIKQAGKRYSPHLNIKTPLVEKFQYFGQTSVWKNKLTELSQECTNTFDSWVDSLNFATNLKSDLQSDITALNSLVSNISQSLKDSIVNPEVLIELKFQKEVQSIVETIGNLESDIKNRLLAEYGKEADSRQFRHFSASFGVSFPMEPLDQIRKLRENFETIWQLSKNKIFDLPASKTVLIRGEAGVGKTHGIVDLAKQRIEESLKSLVFFGSDFSDENPWDTMISYTGLSNSIGSDQFLAALNLAGETSGSPLIIFIDALNESKNQLNWENWLPRLEFEISKFPYLKLCVTCRENFVQRVIPSSFKYCDVVHNGFLGKEIESQKAYSNYYGLGIPKNFYFHREFSNPLFLLVYFESLKEFQENKVTDKNPNFPSSVDINSIITMWFESKNNKISKILNFDPRDEKLVQCALENLAEMMITYDDRRIPLEKVRIKINEVTKQNFKQLLNYLEDESLVTVEGQPKKGSTQSTDYFVRFTFERIGDFLIAEQLISGLENYDEVFKPGNSLHKFVKDDDEVIKYSNLLEAFTIRWPELTGKELVDCVDCYDNPVIVESFISSLNWRDPIYITKRTIELILDLLRNLKYTIKGFECLLENSTKEGHPLNVEFLHNYLTNQSMVERDGNWVIAVGESYSGWSSSVNEASPVYKLTEIGNIIKSDGISKSISLLWALISCWFLSSIDRRIRDSATKTLIAILLEKPNIAILLLQKLQNCDDEYITERLLVAIYGALLLNESSEDVIKVSEFLYEKYCNADQWPLNVCLRENIRLIIELALRLNSKDSKIDKSKIQTLVSAVDPVINSTTDRDRPKIDNWWIDILDIGKMRGEGIPSDFLNYEVNPKIRGLVDNKHMGGNFDFKNLDNGFLNAVIKMGYPGKDEICAKFDSLLIERFGSYGGGRNWVERLSKKYNWIILKKLLGQIIDQKRLGNIGTPPDSETDLEVMGLRDIDPTDLRANVHNRYGNKDTFSFKTYTDSIDGDNIKDWCITNDFGDAREFIQIQDSLGNNFYVLNLRFDWREREKLKNDKPYRNVFMKFYGALVNTEDFNKLKTSFVSEESRTSFDLYDEPSDYLGYIGEWPNYGPYSIGKENPLNLCKENFFPVINGLSGILKRETDLDVDESTTDFPKEFYIPSSKLLKFGKLKWNYVNDWKNTRGDSVIVCPRLGLEDDVNGLIVSDSFMNQYLQKNGEVFVVFCYQSKALFNTREQTKSLIVETLLYLQDGKFEVAEQVDRIISMGH